eukprot:c24981_g1_i1 orf=665-2035(-)
MDCLHSTLDRSDTIALNASMVGLSLSEVSDAQATGVGQLQGCCTADPSGFRRGRGGDEDQIETEALQATAKRDTCGFAEKESRETGLVADCGKWKNDVMDERLWGNLPNHLLDNIMAWLPFWSLLRFKSVCRRWNRIADCRMFLDAYRRVPCQDVLFMMFADHLKHKVVAAYNPALDKWHPIPLSHLLPSEPPNYFFILAAAGGLLCVEDMGWPCRSLIVSNLVTRSYRKLPPMIDMKSPYVVGMVAEAGRDAYKILVAQDGETLTSQYYDSKSNTWKMSGSFNRRVALVAGTVFLQGFFYCLTFGPVGLVAYDVNDGSWHDTQITLPPSVTCPHVIEHKGQLMMVAGLEEFSILKSVGIWQLDLSNKTLVEIQRMPDHLFQKLFIGSRGNFFCVGHNGLICFNDNHSPHILMFDIVKQRWWWLPPSPLNHTLKRQSVLRVQFLGFSIEPRLDAVV